jgi:hypothetical protein
MNSFALRTTECFQSPTLRLVPSGRGVQDAMVAGNAHEPAVERVALRLVHEPLPGEHPVLIAGEDSAGRAAVLRDMSRTMPPSTTFEEAGAFWEVLVRAPASSMVILSGELDEIPAGSLMQMLARRHPGLPVVSLDPPNPAREPRASS